MIAIKPITQEDYSIDVELKRSFLEFKPKRLIINEQFIQFKDKKINCRDVTDIRYGIIQMRSYGVNTNRIFEIAIKDNQNNKIRVTFQTAFGIKKDQAEKLYNMILDSLWFAVTRKMINNWYQELLKGKTVTIGNCEITPKGWILNTGWIFKKKKFVKWEHARKNVYNGYLHLKSSEKRGGSISMSLLRDWNAVSLYSLMNWLWEEGRVYTLAESEGGKRYRIPSDL